MNLSLFNSLPLPVPQSNVSRENVLTSDGASVAGKGKKNSGWKQVCRVNAWLHGYCT